MIFIISGIEAVKLFLNRNIPQRYCSVVSSAPTILRPQVRIPSTPLPLFSIHIDGIETVIVIGMRKETAEKIQFNKIGFDPKENMCVFARSEADKSVLVKFPQW